MSERMRFRAYLVKMFFISGFVYPLVVHWTWSKDGWLSAYRIICSTGRAVGLLGADAVAGETCCLRP